MLVQEKVRRQLASRRCGVSPLEWGGRDANSIAGKDFPPLQQHIWSRDTVANDVDFSSSPKMGVAAQNVRLFPSKTCIIESPFMLPQLP
jgi:hypothetical protein